MCWRTPSAFPEVVGDANFRVDPVKCKRIYKRPCASCHGKDGLGKWNDTLGYSNPCKRAAFLPLDVGVVPQGFPFDEVQVKYGPWQPIKAWLDSAECLDNNAASLPKIPEDFNTGYDGMGNFMNPGYPAPRN